MQIETPEHTLSPFYAYRSYLKKQFGYPVQKISLNIGNTCPNRDGTKGYGGCTYCNVASFSPSYCHSTLDLTEQLETGMRYFSQKKRSTKYLAYFQSYTNTYSDSNKLIDFFEMTRMHPKVVGIIVGTRPDCIADEVIRYLSDISKSLYVSVEIGIESTINDTLRRINRCHTYEDTVSAFNRLTGKGIQLGGHLIIGLPGESDSDIITHADKISKLPINTLKLHHLQVIKQTIMEHEFKISPETFEFRSFDEYVDLIGQFLTHLRADIALQRFISQAQKQLLIAPNWNGIKNYQAMSIIENKMREKNQIQGQFL